MTNSLQQVLFSLVEYIASLFDDDAERQRYQTAALSFRIPYMDWAAQPPEGESVLPFSVGGSAFINASGPNGVQQIANPLYTYLFKPLNASMFIEAPVRCLVLYHSHTPQWIMLILVRSMTCG